MTKLDDKPEFKAMAERILAVIPETGVDHDALWRLCGCPRDADSYWFDVAVNELAETKRIWWVSIDGRMIYGHPSRSPAITRSPP